jgi:hypothetical protein
LFSRNGTLKHSLSSISTFQEIEKWKKINFDEPLSKNIKNLNNTILIQKTPGLEFGVSFIVQEEQKKTRCVTSDGNGFRVS